MELWTVLISPLGLAVTTGGVLLTGYLIYSYAYAPFQVLKRCGIKGPQPKPFFGSYKEIRKLGILKFYEELYKQYGPVCGYYIGQRPDILLADPEIIKHIMVKEFNNFTDREQLPNLVASEHSTPVGIVQANGEAWRRQRQILSPTFSTAKMRAMVPILKNSTDTLIEKLGEFAESRRSEDVCRAYNSFAMETILATAFGRVIDFQRGEADELTKACTTFFSGTQDVMASLALIIVLLTNFPCLIHVSRFLFRWVWKETVLDVFHKTALSLVKARREEGNSIMHKDLLQLMIDAAEREGGEVKKLTDEEIVTNSILFLLAGYETTANTLAYTSYLLALHPEIQEKLQTEIDGYFETKPEASMYEATQELHYLDMVVQESLRMYPTGVRTSRLAQKTIEINGVTIPKGTTVQLPIHLLQHNPEYWPEPEKFDPERFTPEEKARRPAVCHMPFGWGPRNCIGMRFALMEIKMTLIEILKKYKFVRTPETEVPLKLDAGLTISPKNGIKLRIATRK